MIPNIPEFAQKFNKVAVKHKFKMTNEKDNKVRGKIPLREREC